MKRIILCADGTGNKGGTTPDTNVFRIYNAIAKKDLNESKQITYYDKGVGTSSNKLLGGIAGAFGFGLKNNVRDLYEFLARHYEPGDEIFLFGFSRGAATVRAFAGMIQACGLLNLYKSVDNDPNTKQRKPEVDFQKEIDEAMAFYVKNGVQSKTSLKVAPPKDMTKSWGDTYIPGNEVPITFIGVWDTVSAMGFPKDWSWVFNRFFRLLDKASDIIWPHRFYNYQLSNQVKNVYQALALDDERRTFHPRVWREEKKDTRSNSKDSFLRPKHIEQVWFSGVHSNVGGGYERDGLAIVTLDWMVKRACAHGLVLKEGVQAEVAQDANAHGKIYDSRAGLGIYYRYAPRNLEALCLDTNKIKKGSIKIHESVFDRMEQVTENYAPGQLPFDFQIVKSQIYTKPKACQAAVNKETWNKVTLNIAKFVDWRRRLYTIQAELSLLVLLFAWFFWLIPPALTFSEDGSWLRHIVDVLYYLTPEFMEGLITYSFANHPLIGLTLLGYIYFHYKIRSYLKRRTNYFCRQARDHLIHKKPIAIECEDQTPVEVSRKHIRFILVEGAGLVLVAISVVLIFINILATFQGTSAEIDRDFSGRVFRHVNKCSTPIQVNANQYWNASGLLLEKNVEYRIDINDEQTWKDASEPATQTGWKNPEKGIIKFLGKTLARDTDKGLFYLMGAIHGKCKDGRPCGYQFPIQSGEIFTAEASGEFYTFANDLPFMYGNNSGKIKIEIIRVSKELCGRSGNKVP